MSKQLNSNQRQEIAKLLQEGKDFGEIAEVLQVNRTTILREINRNAGENGVYDPEMAEQKTRRRKKLRSVSPGAVAQLPPSIRTEMEKVWAFETPSVKRRQLIVDKYIKDYGPIIKKKLISPKSAMLALANEFFLSESAIYYLLRREGVYKDAAHPVCLTPPEE